jgi:two-component system, NtrC family, response regulator AtoC
MTPAFSLLVITPSGVLEHALPTAGRASIGRAEGSTIRLDDGSVSRQHAALHVAEDGSLRIEDLGAANGTRVHPKGNTTSGETQSLKALRRESLPIATGDRILLGSVSAIVVRRANVAGTAASSLVCDPRMKELYAELERAAASNINVLLLGETGVGKEVLARELHARSRRASGPFLAINCAALPETLLEAELFGHERGAFTGAHQARPGLFESANGGSLFIDEVGELPLTTQVKLLRVLEERKVVRVGGRTERSSSRRPTATWRPQSSRAISEATCIFAWLASFSAFRLCVSVAWRSCHLPARSCSALPPSWTVVRSSWRRRPWPPWRAMPGRAMCVS